MGERINITKLAFVVFNKIHPFWYLLSDCINHALTIMFLHFKQRGGCVVYLSVEINPLHHDCRLMSIFMSLNIHFITLYCIRIEVPSSTTAHKHMQYMNKQWVCVCITVCHLVCVAYFLQSRSLSSSCFFGIWNNFLAVINCLLLLSFCFML